MADLKSDSGYASVNGLDMYYEIHGKGKPLVLIHGGGSTIETSFGHILPLLAVHYKIIAVELQAHGHTKDRDTPSSFKQDADDVAALLKSLNIDKASFFGFSNGGHTTIEIALRHPAFVNKLVIVSSFYKRSGVMPGFFDGISLATIDNMPQIYKDVYLKLTNDPVGLQRMFNRDKTRMVEFRDWTEEAIESISFPSLLICGDKDVNTPEHAVEMWRKLPNAELMILPGNHGSFIGEMMTHVPNSRVPELTVGIVRDFLDR